MTRNQELVAMDERFIRWLAATNCKTVEQRYVVVSETNDDEVSLNSYGSLEDFRRHVEVTSAFSGSWRPIAIFDTVERKQVKFDLRTTVVIL